MLTVNPTEALVVRYGEIALKGGMRTNFEQRLVANLRVALTGMPDLAITRTRGRIFVRSSGSSATAMAAIARVFGVVSVSPAGAVQPELAAIQAMVLERTAAALAEDFPLRDHVRFGVRVNRANPGFPLSSNQLAGQLGGELQALHPCLKVDLDHPELRVEVDLREDRALIFVERVAGPGGLPVGALGRALCLLSGGIDSPVAGWMGMRRGLRLEFLSFISPPHTGAQTVAKVERLVEHLADWQPVTWIHFVPMTEIQQMLRARAPDSLGTVLDRRSMMRMAARLARRRHCRALLTGESLGQVASQTLENLSVIEQAADLPILRPVVMNDKEDTIAIARRIGTFDLSTLPAPDSCTVWLPRAPVLRARVADVLAAEEGLPLAELEEQALRNCTSRRIPT
jgi:thiamine biosynthesis protein ThiI